MHASGAILLTTLVAFLLLPSNVMAAVTADCAYPESWLARGKKMDPNVQADLSQCQVSAMSLKDDNNILVGGEGSASTFTVNLGSGGGGCNSNTDCMLDCQALCCITNGCKYVSVKRETKKDCEIDCSIYKEEEKKWYCRMISSGSYKDSDTQATCELTNPSANRCYDIGRASGFGWNSTTMDSLKSLGTSCASGRKLAAQTGKFKGPQSENIEAKLSAVRSFGAKLRAGVKKAYSNAGSGVCSFRNKVSKNLQC